MTDTVALELTACDVHGDFHAEAKVDGARGFPNHVELLSIAASVGELPQPIMQLTARERYPAIMKDSS